jgi:hypothetical protein
MVQFASNRLIQWTNKFNPIDRALEREEEERERERDRE